MNIKFPRKTQKSKWKLLYKHHIGALSWKWHVLFQLENWIEIICSNKADRIAIKSICKWHAHEFQRVDATVRYSNYKEANILFMELLFEYNMTVTNQYYHVMYIEFMIQPIMEKTMVLYLRHEWFVWIEL